MKAPTRATARTAPGSGPGSGAAKTKNRHSSKDMRAACPNPTPPTAPLWTPPCCGQRYPPKPASSGREMSGFSSSSTFTSLKVITRTFLTKRAGLYMSQTQASCISTSK